MVNIVIMRHGEAEQMSKLDNQRPLSTKGKRETLQMAQWLHHYNGGFSCLWVSPYLRTVQTADIMLSQQGPECQLETISELVPEGKPQLIHDLIDARLSEQPDATILLVSHMPMVSFLVEALTQSGQTPVFSTAALCCIDYQPAKGGRLVEKVSPQDLALLSH